MRHFLILSTDETFPNKIAEVLPTNDKCSHLSTPTSLVVALNESSCDGIFWDISNLSIDTVLATLLLIREQVIGPIFIFTKAKSAATYTKLYKEKVDFVTAKKFDDLFLKQVINQRLWVYQHHFNKPNKKARSSREQTILKFDDLAINLKNFTVTKDNEPILLTPKEFQLLAYLAQNHGQVISREQLLQKVWGYDLLGSSRIVDIHISHLRDKIENDSQNPVHLKTKRGFGYKFE